MGNAIEGAVRLIKIVVNFTKPNFVPEWIKERDAKKWEFSANKSSSESAEPEIVKCIEPIEKVGCVSFLDDIMTAGYVLAGAIRYVKAQTYYVAEFSFVPAEHDTSSAGFCQEMRPKAEKVLREWLEKNMWRVHVNLKAYTFEGEKVDKLFVNLESRFPMFEGDKPIAEWKKDENGKKIGEAPIPRSPKSFLKFENGDAVIYA